MMPTRVFFWEGMMTFPFSRPCDLFGVRLSFCHFVVRARLSRKPTNGVAPNTRLNFSLEYLIEEQYNLRYKALSGAFLPINPKTFLSANFIKRMSHIGACSTRRLGLMSRAINFT